jgi:hypothetical protein
MTTYLFQRKSDGQVLYSQNAVSKAQAIFLVKRRLQGDEGDVEKSAWFLDALTDGHLVIAPQAVKAITSVKHPLVIPKDGCPNCGSPHRSNSREVGMAMCARCGWSWEIE